MEQKGSQKEATRTLWNLCFKDSKEFNELYFNLRYKDEINSSIYENGEMVAALQMIPYPMTFCNRIIPTSYISGACTHPDSRNRGVMKKLLAQTFMRMYKDGVFLSTLIPAENWLFEYYTQSGYTPAFDYSTERIDISSLNASADYPVSIYSSNQPEIQTYLEHKLKDYPCSVLHTIEDLYVILADLKLSGGELLIAHHKEEIVGLAFCIPDKEEIYFSELLYDNQEVRNNLLREAFIRYKLPYAKCVTPIPNKDSQKLGMARIINAHKMLQLYANKNEDIHLEFELFDEFLPINNGSYLLEQGICKRIDKPKGSYIKLTVNQLTQTLMGYHTEQLPKSIQPLPVMNPYMSLMLN